MKKSKGFSLVELMIVVAVIGIMATIIAPNLVSGLPTYRIKAAVRDSISQFRKARSTAIKEKRNVFISFDAEEQIFLVDGRKFPSGGSFTKEYGSGVIIGKGQADTAVDGGSIPSDGIGFSGKSFAFTSRGMADSGAGNMTGAIYFTNNKEQTYAVTVNAAGAVSMMRWRGDAWTR